jgi:hypothetical protein
VRLALDHLAPHLAAVVVSVRWRPADGIPMAYNPALVLAVKTVFDHRPAVAARTAAT